MNFYKFFLKALLLNVVFSFNLFAKEASNLDEVIVTAPAVNNFSDKQNIQDIKNFTPIYFFSDGADYLKSIPAITSGRFGGHGLEPFIRGQSQNRLNIIADDSFTFGGCPNRMDPPASYVNINSYDDIIITKGYQSVLNSFGATGGTIEFKRNKPNIKENSISGNLANGYDSNSNSWNSNLNITAGNQKNYVRAHGSIKDANNYEDGDGNEIRSSFNEKSGGFKIGYTPNNDHFYLSYDIHEIKDSLFAGSSMDSPLSQNQTFKAGFEKKFDSGLVKNIDFNAYTSFVDHEMDNYSLRTPPANNILRRVDSKSNSFGSKLKTDLSFKDHLINTLIEYRFNNQDADRYQGSSMSNVNNLQSIMWPDIASNEVGLAAQTIKKISSLTRLKFGVRYDYVNVDFRRADQVASVSGLSANDLYQQFYGYQASTQTEHNFGGLIRYEYDLNDKSTTYLAISRSVRTANATERGLASHMVMMGNNLSWVGNPHIKPEKHHQFDIGYIIKEKDFNIDVSAYINHINDFIFRDSARAQDGILINATNADIYRNIEALISGFEIAGKLNILNNLEIFGDATYTYGKNISNHIPLSQIPPLQGKLGFKWQAYEYLGFSSNMRWAMKQSRVDNDPAIGSGLDVAKTSGYAVFDLEAKITKLKPIEFSLGISNLFDKKYANHLNRSNISDPTQFQVNEAGRSFYLKANLIF